MSNNRKNNHYHFAEKYETRQERRARRRKGRRFVVHPVAMLISVVMLVLFGIVSTTFSVYITNSENDPDMPASGGLIVKVGNQLVSSQPQSTGIVTEKAIESAETASESPTEPQNIISKKISDLAEIGANVDLTGTGSFYIGGNGVKFFYLDTEGWGSVNMYYWGNGWSNNAGLTNISGTKIYYYSFGSTWTGLDGFLFNKANNDWTNKGPDLTSESTSTRWFFGTSDTAHTDFTTYPMHQPAKVVNMLSTDGGATYVEGSSEKAITTISGVYVSGSATSTTAASDSTSANDADAQINAAYGSTVTLTANTSAGATFKGFSTVNSSTLPSGITSTTPKTYTATGYKGQYTYPTNDTYYAYYQLDECTPQIAIDSDEIYEDETTTITTDHSLSGCSGSITYTVTKDGSTVTSSVLSATSGTNPVTFTPAGTGDYEITATCNHNGRSSTETITVKSRPDMYVMGLTGTYATADNRKMAFDSSTKKYTLDIWLAYQTTYSGSANSGANGFKFYSTEGDTWFGPATDNYTVANGSTYTTNTNSGNNNYKMTTTNAGVYKFTFDPASNEFTVAFPTAKYYLLGFDNTWLEELKADVSKAEERDLSNSVSFDFTADNANYTGTANGFKVYYTGSNTWYGNDGTIYYSDTENPYRDASNGWVFETSKGNCSLHTWYSGTYTFSWNSLNKKLTMTSPTRSVAASCHLGSTSGTELADFVTIADNHDDTFTLTAADPDDVYELVSWVIPANATLTSGTTTSSDITLTVTSSSAVAVDSIWKIQSYPVYLYTSGGTVSASGFSTSSTAADYEGEYTWGVGLTLPTTPTYSGYTFAGWYTNENFTGDPVTSISSSDTGEKSFYAKWLLTVTFKDNIHGITLYTVNVNYNSSLTAPTKANWAIADAQLEAEGYEFSGNFDKPLNNMTASKSTIYALYKPKSYGFTITFTPGENVTDINGSAPTAQTGTTAANPYVISFGAQIKAQVDITVPSTLDSKITYKWYVDNGSGAYTEVPSTKITSESNTVVSYTNENISTLMTQPSSGNNGVAFTLYVKAFSKDYNNGDIDSGTTMASATVYYKINTPLNGIVIEPDQKIYSSAPDLSASLGSSASTVLENLVNTIISTYKTKLLYFDKTPGSEQYSVLSDNVAITQTTGNSFLSRVTAAIYGVVDSAATHGVNNFKFTLKRPDPDNSGEYIDDSTTTRKQITVGTATDISSRPLFISRTSGSSLTSRKVMLFYINDSNALAFQTATNYDQGNNTDSEVYRFDIPSYVTQVFVAAFDDSQEYVLPTYSSADSELSWPSSTYCVAHSEGIAINASTHLIRVSVSGTSITANAGVTQY